jgi:TM2 domain-containing membrane protein YozV
MHFGARKSRTLAVGLSLVFGGLGLHKFYLDKPGMGLLYMLFCWTGIPTLVGLFEAVKYIRMDEEEFQRRFYRKEL